METKSLTVVSCSGASNTGKYSDIVARQLMQSGQAKMLCLARFSIDKQFSEKSKTEIDKLVVLDGCPINCCVDATVIPFIEQKLNLSFGCYGCRDATDIGNNESVLGFPFKDFHQIYDSLIHLNIKAIPNSRGKNAYTILRKRDAEKIAETDPFKN